MRAAGLDVRVDAAGNILGRRAGSDPSRKPLLFGSHIDSVPDGGNYDGDVGSLSAIEVAQTLGERGVALRHPIEVVVFQNEEGGTVGSRAMAGQLEPAALTLTARSGKVTRDGIAFIGGDPDRLESAVRKRGDIAAYVELHIEQGGTLEEKKIDIGVVLGIVGIGWWDVTVDGFANHAGTTPMDKRQDALLATARFIEMVNRVVTSEAGRQVGTVGRIQALPGAPNVIPGKVTCSLELRDLDPLKIERLYQRVHEEAQRIATASQTTFTFAETHRSVPALTDPRLQALIENVALDRGLTATRLPSGAGHDAQYVAQICAGRDDLRAERRRHQPLAEGIHEASGRRQRRERAARHDPAARQRQTGRRMRDLALRLVLRALAREELHDLVALIGLALVVVRLRE